MADRTVSVRLKAEVADYMAKFSAASKAAGDLGDKVDNASGKTKQGMDIIGRSMIGIGAAGVAGFGFAVKASMDFDKEMSQLKAATGEGAAGMSDLRDAAIQTGKDTVFSASEAAEAETALAKAGVSTADILGGALAGTVSLAAAGQLDLAEAAETAASAMTQFKLEGSDVAHIADLLAAGAGKAQGSVHDLGMALGQAGLVASQTGLSIEETVGGLAAFANAGLIGSDAGTSFKTMLQRLTPQSAEAAQKMDDLHLSAYDAQGNFIGLADYAGKLRHSLLDMSDAERSATMQVLFGSDAIRAAAVLYENGAKGVNKWVDAVNDQGYAQAFAATALDNLAGDIEALKGSIETGLIQTGSKANGVMREMVQDVTKVVNIYNDLPGPVQGAATAILGIGGAVTLAGGAALMFIPKWMAMNAALAETRMGAISAGGALRGLAKGTAITAGLIGIYEAAKSLSSALEPLPPDVDLLTDSLVSFARQGVSAGELAKTFGTGLADLAGEAGKIIDEGKLDKLNEKLDVFHLTHGGGGIREARRDFDSLDQSLAALVEGGNADAASDAFDEIAKRLKAAGYTTEQIVSLLPDYAHALQESAGSADAAGTGIDKFGNAVGDAAKQTEAATDAAKDYSDQLHALADPLFAMNNALGDLEEAQKAASKAVRKYGADSEEARQANLDLAAAALDVKTASADLTTAVATGSVSMREAKDTLYAWRDAGLITDRQARTLIGTFRGLIGTAKDYSDLHPHVDVTANTAQAKAALDRVRWYLNQIHDKNVDITVRTLRIEQGPGGVLRQTPAGSSAGGGPVFGLGSGTSDSNPYMLSRGEYVVRADGSNLDAALRFYGRPAPAAGGSGSGSSWQKGSAPVYNVEVNYPTPEPASESVPRVLREVAYISGGAW